jgi:autotransporter strand-loop-strand O-heptosyltransferase
MKYDFIEIGTSDFDTLIEQADEKTVGLSIEPLKYYLDKLPDKPNVKKLNVAISSKDSYVDIYYIPEVNIIKHNLPYWVRGSNSIGKPHKFTIEQIGKELYNQLVLAKQVKCISVATLIKDNDIECVDYLKIDTEGMDHVIISDYLDQCISNPKLLPKKIKFERNPNISNISEINHVMDVLKTYGYSLQGSESDVVAILSQIPRIIHQTFKNKDLPPEIQESVDNLKKMNPTFEYRFYDDQGCEDFIRDSYPEVINDYLSINPIYGAARADFFRYLLMYKVGGVYLDIKSSTRVPLEEIIQPTDEYLLTHWEGKDWAEELGYVHGELQNWQIICRPEHPFLKEVIKLVRSNLKNYKGELGKEAVLRLTGPIAYSKAIIPMLNEYRKMVIDSPVREFATAEEIGLVYMNTPIHHHHIYPNGYNSKESIVMNNSIKFPKAYVLYANKAYFNTVKACVRSIKTFSEIPIIVYLINCDDQVEGATTINWKCDVPDIPVQREYIDRKDFATYRMMVERPVIVRDALLNFADEICYVDADSVATPYVDNIFSYIPTDYPLFVEGIYEYFMVDGRGAPVDGDLSKTLEAPACNLFGVNQYVRKKYHQTGYFIANANCIPFLEEWYDMCMNPTVLEHNAYYAPYNEETIANVLLWKHNFQDGLPYIYCNASLDKTYDIVNDLYAWGKVHGDWFRLPDGKENLLFIHGEKDPEIMNKMTDIQFKVVPEIHDKMKIMFLAPHLSTGGMPEFLRKRIEALKNYADVDIYVVEYQCHSLDFIVQRSAILKLVEGQFTTLYEDKMELFRYIEQFQPDIIHIDEMSERLDQDMVNRLYSNARGYRIVETCHDISFIPSDKQLQPDMYIFCTPYHLDTFADQKALKSVIEFPIDKKEFSYSIKAAAQRTLGFDTNKKHVLNVGLWAKWKNQEEGLEIARRFPDLMFHFVGNQAGNFQDYWKPLMKDVPDNVVVWGERNDVNLFLIAADVFMFNSTWECNPLVLREAISYGLPIVSRNLPQYKNMFTPYLQSLDSDLSVITADYEVPVDNVSRMFAEKHITMYNEALLAKFVPQTPAKKKARVSVHFVDNPYLGIEGDFTAMYNVKFFDRDNLVYENTVSGKDNPYIKLNRRWFTPWRIEVRENGRLIYNETLSFKDKRVFISFESKALGDTLAWLPYMIKFKEKHQCHLIVSTFWNKLYKHAYPEIEFVEPGHTAQNINGMYRLGYFYDLDGTPILPPSSVPLQKTACDILGLEYEELLPRQFYVPKKRMYGFKYVVIATNATAGCKFWQKEDWQKVVNFIVSKGYKVMNVSKEKNPFKGVDQLIDASIENTMHVIWHSEFMIGLSSGLSWLNWAMGKKTVMIANFTNKDYEFKTNCIRLVNEAVCHDCWSTEKFNMGDYHWYPRGKGTPREFECQRSISAESVIEKLKTFII